MGLQQQRSRALPSQLDSCCLRTSGGLEHPFPKTKPAHSSPPREQVRGDATSWTSQRAAQPRSCSLPPSGAIPLPPVCNPLTCQSRISGFPVKRLWQEWQVKWIPPSGLVRCILREGEGEKDSEAGTGSPMPTVPNLELPTEPPVCPQSTQVSRFTSTSASWPTLHSIYHICSQLAGPDLP